MRNKKVDFLNVKAYKYNSELCAQNWKHILSVLHVCVSFAVFSKLITYVVYTVYICLVSSALRNFWIQYFSNHSV